jgi:iron complex transport system substrate-binding protein
MFGEVASILGATAVRKLAEWDEQFQATCGALETSRKAEPTPALLLEWLDPPFSCGHWNPELITLANGRDLLAQPGARSRRYAWSELEAIRPQAIIVAPCGRTLEQTRTEVLALDGCEQWRVLRDAASCIVLADGNSYFARPGPQLLQSLRILGRALDPMADLATPHSGWEFLKR